jgi:predicted membrane GTPase involved in stress response
MPTTKERINITTDRDMEIILKRLAKHSRVPVATKAAELIRIALELQEDVYLGKIADGRTRGKVKFIPHDIAWK